MLRGSCPLVASDCGLMRSPARCFTCRLAYLPSSRRFACCGSLCDSMGSHLTLPNGHCKPYMAPCPKHAELRHSEKVYERKSLILRSQRINHYPTRHESAAHGVQSNHCDPLSRSLRNRAQARNKERAQAKADFRRGAGLAYASTPSLNRNIPAP